METDAVRLSAPAESELRTYRAITPWAPLALIFALASMLALAHPALWCLPVISLVMALVALRVIARDPESVGGRKFALIALGMAIVFGAWAPTRYATERLIIGHHALEFAQAWVELLREGSVHNAHQWTVHPSLRVDYADLKDYYETDDQAREEIATFVSRLSIRDIVSQGASSQIQLLHWSRVFGTNTQSLVNVYYEVRADQQSTTPLRVSVERLVSSGKVQWQIREIDEVRPESN